jgi:hypothetical protein
MHSGSTEIFRICHITAYQNNSSEGKRKTREQMKGLKDSLKDSEKDLSAFTESRKSIAWGRTPYSNHITRKANTLED